ncbi:uncharacterized protein BX664DRAFT_339136 [Halteromyces radiatus]|uniref:uncharacterized protein n=1 Tax=Halteromyces radiatus TaxID=101107 RepID=UPI0022202DC8|nr:uncharacterized protein BX664DRAFT_339136 [Halteromyces radiatus]KAI8082821.1 hypothetical protein BX664DRAFT_339136 [Halteromyces radiatus]
MKCFLLSLIFIVLGLTSIPPSTCFDFKNIIFGTSGPVDNHGKATKDFGYIVPPRLVKKHNEATQETCAQGYLCQDTKKCVSEPRLCPCRLAADIKCPLGRDWYTCIRGDQHCEQITEK